MEVDYVIRPILHSDNAAICSLIKDVLASYQANKPGTAFYDDSLKNLSQTFTEPGSGYRVAERNKVIIGGCGIYPTDGLPAGYCELVKFYVAPNVRGSGIGAALFDKACDFARSAGYTHIYLETLPELLTGLAFYEKKGFNYLASPLGNSGHFGCSIWMEITL
ncbi:GNAT family N-acetyltransferase [Mucilaginibacter roseus]|uniref:GNAT family N-acetyltransferase n=1 Tax=Mucilaginibacter roseus TaxID=1528868 RepID=A0ABS8TYA5_9SPHI|nr:GNAT family N-acetyltransferase [Mucilaginibacter roseus]MCD8739357.1 GNAT family N-acetyltransferase [Mucilaginibacter roseus]